MILIVYGEKGEKSVSIEKRDKGFFSRKGKSKKRRKKRTCIKSVIDNAAVYASNKQINKRVVEYELKYECDIIG